MVAACEVPKASNQGQSPLGTWTRVELQKQMLALGQRKGFREAAEPGAGDGV